MEADAVTYFDHDGDGFAELTLDSQAEVSDSLTVENYYNEPSERIEGVIFGDVTV